MYMRMPVETTAIRVDGAADTGFQPPFSGGIQQILHRQTAHVIQQPAVAFEHRPQRVRQGEDQVYPVANRGDMLTSEQHRCSNEKKKFQRRV